MDNIVCKYNEILWKPTNNQSPSKRTCSAFNYYNQKCRDFTRYILAKFISDNS